jgi:hypothetical protein
LLADAVETIFVGSLSNIDSNERRQRKFRRDTAQTCPKCGTIRSKAPNDYTQCECGCIVDCDVAGAQIVLTASMAQGSEVACAKLAEADGFCHSQHNGSGETARKSDGAVQVKPR